MICGRYSLATLLIVSTVNATLLGTKLSYPVVFADIGKGGGGPGLYRLPPPWIDDTIHSVNVVGIELSESFWKPIPRGTFTSTWLPDVIFVISGTLAWTILVPVLALLVHGARGIMNRSDGERPEKAI